LSSQLDPTRYRRARAIFLAAVDARPEDRARVLAEGCRDDADLRREVEELLEADSRPGSQTIGVVGSSLESLVLGRSLVGRHIGRYRVVREIGSGGMGRVYEAVQESPQRSVALKVMRSLVATPEVLRRFEFEVELLAQLRHPGIAQVFEAGTFDDGEERVPWFAMELVAGARSLDHFVREAELGLRERIGLLAEICDAVHHGHQRGIVHRDLKPGNVLVDSDGRPRIIDFGVAKSTNSDIALTTLHTHLGSLVGTLQYMSPEQCDSDPAAIDARTDVYSLGVLLYELLCGRPPYEVSGRSLPSAARTVREHEPERPSAIRRSLRGDLEAIVLKAIEKDRERRYSSAADLAADLRRFLAGEPVEARAATWWWRLSRWIGRRPVLATAIACAMIVILVAAAVLVTLDYTLRRPDHLVLDPTRRVVRLVSRAGTSLHEWDSRAEGGVLLSEDVVRPAPSGDQRLLIVGWSESARNDLAGEFTVHDERRPEATFWGSRDAKFVPPADEPERAEAKFVLRSLLVDDVLPDSPGKEIVALFRLNLYSASTVRVYDLDGGLLYEAWHDGALDAVRWLPGARKLVVTGLDSEFRWDERGVRAEKSDYPAVVFALEPRRGRVGSPQWTVRRGRRQDPSLAWYRWLGPADRVVVLHTVIPFWNEGVSRLEAGSTVSLRFVGFWVDSGQPKKPSLGFVLDGDGGLLTRYAADEYKTLRDAGVLPNEMTFDLLDFEALPPGAHKADGPR